MNVHIKVFGFGASNKVKNHCPKSSLKRLLVLK